MEAANHASELRDPRDNPRSFKIDVSGDPSAGWTSVGSGLLAISHQRQYAKVHSRYGVRRYTWIEKNNHFYSSLKPDISQVMDKIHLVI
jgi:hypothetical protein